MIHASQDLYLNAINAVPGVLPSKFTMSEKPYIWSRLCNVNIKMYLFTILFYFIFFTKKVVLEKLEICF